MPRLTVRFAMPALCAGLVAGMLTTTGGALAPASLTRSAAPADRATSVAAPLETITENGESALSSARAAIADARTVTDDIAASGLEVEGGQTPVDTTELAALADRLESLDITPTILLPDLTADTVAETASVSVQAAALRGRLDAAIQKKAEEEAAAKAAAEAAQKAAEEAAARAAAEAQAAAEAAAAAKKAQASTAAPAVNVNVDPASAQGIARSMMAASYGWGDDQFACLVSLWNKESGWRVNAQNKSSGAYGIPQALPGSKMGSAGADWATNPATQIAWGLGYISGRYGTPCGAWGHSQSTGWY